MSKAKDFLEFKVGTKYDDIIKGVKADRDEVVKKLEKFSAILNNIKSNHVQSQQALSKIKKVVKDQIDYLIGLGD